MINTKLHRLGFKRLSISSIGIRANDFLSVPISGCIVLTGSYWLPGPRRICGSGVQRE